MQLENAVIKQGFEILPHAVGLRMRAQGKTVKELFRNALRGMAFYLAPDALKPVRSAARIATAIAIEAVDLNSLLVEFLSEAIARGDGLGAVFAGATFRTFGENFLEGEISGTAIEEFARDIKAVSYQEVDIKRNSDTGLFETELVFEV